MERTIEGRIMGGLAHAAVLLSWIGPVAILGLYFAYRSRSRYVADHARQGLALSIFGLALYGTITLIYYLAETAGGIPGHRLEPSYYALWFGRNGLIVLLAVWGAVRGFLGQEHRYPVIGNLAARIGG